jgi:hypothetical protein
LGSPQFQVREKATKELAAIGDMALPSLRMALAGILSPEIRQRLVSILDRFEGVGPSPEVLRQIRAIEALEKIGNPEARRLIEKLAAGAPELPLRSEARASAGRLAGRSATAK